MKTQLNAFLSKELSRRDFLKVVASTLILAMGVQNFITYLSRYNRSPVTPKIDTPGLGFGSNRFGE